MKIVIDIPEKTKEFFDSCNCMNDTGWTTHLCELINAFKNGTPLPKGHGRLIDSDDMIENLQRQCKEVFKLDAVKPEDYYIAKDAKFMQATWKEWCDSFCVWANNRKAIIEADGGDAE